MTRIVIQKGHCYRTRGATGTSGHRGTEQAFVDQLGDAMWRKLNTAGVDAIIALADDRLPDCDVFIALHQDGSSNRNARGASVGYPPTNNPGRELAQLWKTLYQQAGWPSGFRPDNYTRALSGYYAYRRVNAHAKVLLEHGFATNATDADWMWDNIDTIATVNVDTLLRFTGHITPTDNEDEPGMQIVTDSENGRQWLVWTYNGTTIVREYSRVRPGAGDDMPGVAYVIDKQIREGTILEASR